MTNIQFHGISKPNLNILSISFKNMKVVIVYSYFHSYKN